MRARHWVLLALITCIHAESMLVTVQSNSQQDMDALTASIDAEVQNVHSGMRTTLGAIEATMSRVVDVDDPYFVAPALSVPTWAMLHDIQFDESTSSWTFEYKTMKADAAAPQLQEMNVEIAAAIIMKLPARQSGLILSEMDPQKAGVISMIISSAANPNTSKDRS